VIFYKWIIIVAGFEGGRRVVALGDCGIVIA
jgi:hypothetical protein